MKIIQGWILQILFVVFACSLATAQKVKYKEVFVLLNAKKYEDAEPHLKRYLADAKEGENPSGYLFMAKIYEEKSKRSDFLKQTNAILNQIDSSLYYFDLAKKFIDEKEIKKNSDYYEEYNRRDLRTGKFEIKLSDIQFKINDSVESLNQRRRQAILLRSYFDNTIKHYKLSNELYTSIQAAYEDSKALYLLADEGTIEQLKKIQLNYDSAISNFDRYKNVSRGIGKTGYNHNLAIEDIKDFKRDGKSMPDFLDDNIRFWDYKTWVTNANQIIVNEIGPVKKHLIDFDIEINKISEVLKRDSVSVSNDLARLVDRILSSQLRKYDPDPLPMALFSVKIAELQYFSDKLDNQKKTKGAAITEQLAYAKIDLKNATKFYEIADQLANRPIEKEATNYADFIQKTYGNVSAMHSFARANKDYASRELKGIEAHVQILEKSLDWIIVGQDSIPLNSEKFSTAYRPLLIEADKYTFGLSTRSGKRNGYFAIILPTRKSDVFFEFDLQEHFSINDIHSTSAIAYEDPAGQMFILVYYTTYHGADEVAAIQAQVIKIYKSDGVAWNTEVVLSKKPFGVNYKMETGEVSLFYDMVEGVSKSLILDKNGNPKTE
jgi:hypothetical protein